MGQARRRRMLDKNYGQPQKIASKSDYLRVIAKYLRSLTYFVKTERDFDLFVDVFEGMVKFNPKEAISGLLRTYHPASKDYPEACVVVAPNLDCFAMNFSDLLELFIAPTSRQEYKKLYSEKGDFIPILLYSYDIEYMMRGCAVPEDYWHIFILLDISKCEVKENSIPKAFGANNYYDLSKVKINITKG